MPDEPVTQEEIASDAVDPAFYGNGGVSLSESEIGALGIVEGRRVLALGAGNGEDFCSLVNLGAKVTVLDDADSLATVRDLAGQAGLELEFTEDAPAAMSVENRT